MKRIFIILGIALLLPLAGMAQQATGTLTVTANVQSYITFAFEPVTGGAPLTSGVDSNAATLDLGSVSANGTSTVTNVTVTPQATNMKIDTKFGVKVFQANTTSGSLAYDLQAALNNADSTNTWQVAGGPALGTTATTVASAVTSGSTVQTYDLAVTVPYSEKAGGISNKINFTATAN